MKAVFVDVREPEEYQRGHLEGAINLPPSEIVAGAVKLKDLPKDTPLVLYCISGSRSNVSKNILESLGFTNVTNGINQQQVEAKYLK
ncbi:hypothetical protein A3F64_00820 [Candidatus Saccharibacteria bacterium RIFCSPHIGHO2_12_FULL_42_8]|nr:MAG: hypothetical protein A3F64_00820 [Candidatus Saccharibacteria bacterium RIFCSPHIGHO2_12_FULL_42_8]